jgi:nucleotide-binding universal stress UspA family protein
MRTIKHLLCPVDLSGPSAGALRFSAALNSVVDGDLTILYVRAPRTRQPDPGKSSDTSLETFVSSVLGPSPEFRLMEQQGEPVTEILRAAVAADIVIMGTHGRTGLQRLLHGSVTERVLRRSAAPVLAVPRSVWNEPQRAIRIENVLCAVDFSEPSVLAVEYAASIAAAAGAGLVLSHVLEWSEEEEEKEATPGTGRSIFPSSEEDAMARLNELLTDEMRSRCAPSLSIGYGPPADEVLRLIHELKADLVVLGIRRRNPIDRAVFGSTTRRLIQESACAVLTVSASESRMPSRAAAP